MPGRRTGIARQAAARSIWAMLGAAAVAAALPAPARAGVAVITPTPASLSLPLPAVHTPAPAPALIAPTLIAPALIAPADPSACERAGDAAERRFALPHGLLLAIGRVESGRYDPTRGRVVPSPFAVDVAGAGTQFDSAEAAIAQVEQALAGGQHNVDVGCFQINLGQHPDAFPTLQQAFDPDANAAYAARFLANLRLKLGGWDQAVAAYHSATPALGIPYRAAVYARWTTPEAGAIARLSAALPDGGPDDPVVVRTAAVPGLHVWGPSPDGSAPSHIAMPRPAGG